MVRGGCGAEKEVLGVRYDTHFLWHVLSRSPTHCLADSPAAAGRACSAASLPSLICCCRFMTKVVV